MNLVAYQRAVMRVAFDREPSEADLQALGQPERYRDVYRHMVRSRLDKMAQVAFKGALAAVGPALWSETFAAYLAERPPRSPLIREVVAAFGLFARDDAAFCAAAPFVRDMLTFEHAKWEVAYQEAHVPALGEGGLRELDFDGSLVLHPVLRLLSLSFPVHREVTSDTPASALHLLVYRPPGRDDIRWWAVDRLFAAVVARTMRCEVPEPLSACVQGAVAEVGATLDQALLEKLSDSLTLAIQRSVVLGVR